MHDLWRTTISTLLVTAAITLPAAALDNAHRDKADASIQLGIEHLRQMQNEDGSWSPQIGPAITAMVVSVMLDRPNISAKDPAVAKALTYIMSKCRDDGGIYDEILANYNTSICLSALAWVQDRPDVAAAIVKAQDFLRGLQWHNQPGPDGEKISQTHPFYGGAGYGRHGRPDMSNTQFMIQGLYDSGLSCDDPAFQRAMVFITHCQGTTANKRFGEKIVQDGGFIYATSIDKKHVGVPESMASPEARNEALAGKPVSNLRTYGSMTYAGFKSYVYAQLSRNDPRVKSAHKWICRNYSIEHNPGLPDQIRFEGYYYYLMTMSRALDAWGSTHVETPDGTRHDWANDIIDKLASLQRKDGSWINDQSSRWMENDPNLGTAYALIALTHAIK